MYGFKNQRTAVVLCRLFLCGLLRGLFFRVRFFPTLGLIGCLSLVGCSTLSDKLGPLPYDATLLSGVAVFGEPVPPHRLSINKMLAPNSAMRTFVRNQVQDHGLTSIRFRRLLQALEQAGYFDGNYSTDITQTAQDTFQTKRGNCLSYTSMIIVLARALDLPAYFQIVDIPPEWDAKGKFLIRNKHINATIGGKLYKNYRINAYTVDFNNVALDESHNRQQVSDKYALALFQANLGIQQLLNSRPRAAFSYLRGSIETYPHNSDLWNNLGAFYATQKAFEQARQAYSVALHIEPNSKTAHSGLARSYTRLGDHEKATWHQAKVRQYRDRNPYYHFGIARNAYEDGTYLSALGSIDRALQLKGRTGKFHFLKALALTKLGKEAAARESLKVAQRYGSFDLLAERYKEDLAIRVAINH